MSRGVESQGNRQAGERSADLPPLRVCFVCTHSLTLATLYKGLFPFLTSRGLRCTVVVGDREYDDFPEEHFGRLQPHIIPMKRLPSPLHDLLALLAFIRFFIANRFDVIHVSTPKASLLASIAAAITFNGHVLFVYRRCVYELMTGWKRTFYKASDRLICAIATAVVPISRQLRDFLVEERICPERKIRFFGSGSSNGVDVERFSLSAEVLGRAQDLRAELSLPPGVPVLLFVGRVCGEKGVDLLPGIMSRVLEDFPDAHLVVAGPDDQRDPATAETKRFFADAPQVRRIGYVADPVPLYALATVFVFPSYFEGFGNVLLEAAAMKKPSVAFRVPGVQEAVADGESGILVEKGDMAAAAAAAVHLLADPVERTAMGDRARSRVERSFDRRLVWQEIEETLRGLAERSGQRPETAAPVARSRT